MTGLQSQLDVLRVASRLSRMLPSSLSARPPPSAHSLWPANEEPGPSAPVPLDGVLLPVLANQVMHEGVGSSLPHAARPQRQQRTLAWKQLPFLYLSFWPVGGGCLLASPCAGFLGDPCRGGVAGAEGTCGGGGKGT